MKQPQLPISAIQFYIPGIEIALNTITDKINEFCGVLGMPGYTIVRSEAPVAVAAPGTSKFTPEEKAELIREYDAYRGKKKTFLDERHLTFALLHGWRQQIAVQQQQKPAPEVIERPSRDPLEVRLHQTKGRRNWTEEEKAEIIRRFDAQPTRGRVGWMNKRRLTYTNLQEWRAGGRGRVKKGPDGATTEQMKAWARAHDGIFDVNAFRERHPNLHVRGLGMQVRIGTFKKVGNRQFKLKES